jgi:Salmonella virulence plasmid 65kDa B protein
MSGRFRCLVSSVSIISMLLQPVAPVALAVGPERIPVRSAQIALSDTTIRSQMIKVRDEPASVFGMSIRRGKARTLASEIDVLVSCHDRLPLDPGLVNITAGCAAFSILSNEEIVVSIPYDTRRLPEGVSENEVRVYMQRVAQTGPMAPVDAYLDIDNKQTVANLSQQAGRFINGVLQPGEGAKRPPHSLSSETLKQFRHADPTRGVPIIRPPQANTSGDLRLSYPLDLPGVRDNFKPQISIGYSAQSSGGNIAVGWNLHVPTISVEARWGVPIYDPKRETETYLFNGEQLVPEAGGA